MAVEAMEVEGTKVEERGRGGEGGGSEKGGGGSGGGGGNVGGGMEVISLVGAGLRGREGGVALVEEREVGLNGAGGAGVGAGVGDGIEAVEGRVGMEQQMELVGGMEQQTRGRHCPASAGGVRNESPVPAWFTGWIDNLPRLCPCWTKDIHLAESKQTLTALD